MTAYRMLNLIPMANDLIVDSLGNGVVVLDIDRQIVDFNRVAQEITGISVDQALAQGHTTDLRRAAHTLKSSSATFGAMALSEMSRQLEYHARDGVLEGAADLLDQIHVAYERAWAALEIL